MSDGPSLRNSRANNDPPSSLLPALGRYRHYKGAEYSVIGFARHSETEERLVLYIPLYGEGECWARPLQMFMEHVEHEGQRMPRFRLVQTLRED